MIKSKRNISWNSEIHCAGYQLHERGALLLYEALDSPVSLSCYLLLKNREYRQLIEKKVNPSDYLGFRAFDVDYQAVSYLRKFPDFDTGIDKDAVALDKFIAAEALCKETNRRLERRRSGVFSTPDVESVLFLAQRKISHVLGRWRPSSLLEGGFGPGVTSSCRGSKTGLSEKFSSELDATRAAVKYVKPIIGATPLWSKAMENSDPFGPEFSVIPRINLTEPDRVTFVPKDASTNRTITVAATFNMFLQKAIGDSIRSKLKRHGVDLNDQSRNQRLAKQASITGELSTIDLKSASDCVSRELVWDLLPYEWACVLDDARHKCGTLPNGETIFYQKWSAMGNGYTFELESLIFYALASAVCQQKGVVEENVGVYGDDIIVPVVCHELLIDVLQYCGFVTNKDKTYSTGYFRESCGADWFFGYNVRPIFQKEGIKDVGSAIRAANRLRLTIQRVARIPEFGWVNPDLTKDPRHSVVVRRGLWKVWQLYVNHIPKNARVVVPEGYGDIGLVGNKSECRTFKDNDHNGFHEYAFLALLQSGAKYRGRNDSATLIQSLKSSVGSGVCKSDTGILIDYYLLRGSTLPSSVTRRLLAEFRSSSPTNGLSSVRRKVHYVRKYITATKWPELED